jgi:hypothetical protein
MEAYRLTLSYLLSGYEAMTDDHERGSPIRWRLAL